MVPTDEQKPVIIFELKKVDKFTLMDRGCEEALRQIEEKHYDQVQIDEGYEKFIKYGICFCKKTCKVKKAE